MNFKEQAAELVSQMTIEEKLSQMCYTAPAIPRLGIPAYNWWNECLHGVARNGTATVFPQSIAMASSFHKERMYEVATVISDEIRAKYNENKKQGFTDVNQGLTMCAPNINIFRDPRWGRGHETYGEDPVLTGMLAAEYIKGLQGNEKYRKADATLKHFAVHSGPEKERHGFNSEVSEADLRETYLKAFAYCVEEADPSAIMVAYNAVNGVPCAANTYLLQDILREEWGFEGYVESDAGAVENMNLYHKCTESEEESAALSINSGCDLCIGSAYNHLEEVYKKGLISEQRVNEAVTRLFEARFRLGMFAEDCEYDQIPYEIIECEKHKEINLQMARESIVLLKNNGILPLDPKQKIAVIGPNADDISVLFATYNGRASDYTTILRGIKEAAPDVMFAVGSHHWWDPYLGRWEERSMIEALTIARKCDVIIMCMGLNPKMECEQADLYSGSDGGDKKSILLPKVQQDLYEKLHEIGKPIVFINVSGSCISLKHQKEECDAVIQCFYPGAMGGKAMADILFGKCSPSGRLPVTFYGSDEDLPDMKDYSMQNRTYKYFQGESVFAFGHGLTYSEISETWTDEDTAIVKNNGPYDTWYSVLQYEYIPHKSLKNFKKIFIRNGETVKCSFGD